MYAKRVSFAIKSIKCYRQKKKKKKKNVRRAPVKFFSRARKIFLANIASEWLPI